MLSFNAIFSELSHEYSVRKLLKSFLVPEVKSSLLGESQVSQSLKTRPCEIFKLRK